MSALVEERRTVRKGQAIVWRRLANPRQVCQPDRRNLLERSRLDRMVTDRVRFLGVLAGAMDVFKMNFKFKMYPKHTSYRIIM